MDRSSGIDMRFIYKNTGRSLETRRLLMRKHILKPEKTRNIGKGKDNE